jgi:NAD(P)-dependent dehydrogenase (short-subunit alcohol dehydrogenase family)
MPKISNSSSIPHSPVVDEQSHQKSLAREAVARPSTARPRTLLKRSPPAEEVAAMVVYMCSPRAATASGATLQVDGGAVRPIV